MQRQSKLPKQNKTAVAAKKVTKKTAKRSLVTKRASTKRTAAVAAAPAFAPIFMTQQQQFTNTAAFRPTTRKFSAVGEGSDPAFAAQPKAQQPQEKSQTEQQQDDILSQIDGVVKAYPVVLFMKGNPSQPRCGFSRRVVQILHEYDITYEACDVLESDELREAIKTYSNWPTLPQLFVGGEFVGGCDIVTQMHEAGELGPVLPINKPKDTPAEAAAKEQAV